MSCLRFLRAMVRWLLNLMVFAMFFAFLAIFAVKLRCVLRAFTVKIWPDYHSTAT